MKLARAALAVSFLACDLPPNVATPASARPLEIHGVEWNPRREKVAPAIGALDLGSDVVLFGERETAILADGALTTTPNELRAGAIIPAPDGSGAWLTAIDARGSVLRLRARRTFEPVSDRYALEGKKVTALTGFGGRYVAFVVEPNDVVIADGARVVHFALGGVLAITGGGSKAWVTREHDAVELDPRTRTMRSYALDAPHVAVSSSGRVWAASGTAIYEQHEGGELALRYVAAHPIESLVASNDRAWFADAGELGAIDGDEVSVSPRALGSGAKLVSSMSGDVWAIDARGGVTRWARGALATTATGNWSDVVSPVFARSCVKCHAPGGSSGVDLSTPEAWRTKHDLIRQRVLVDRDMPPKEVVLSDADRATLATWLAH